MVLNKNTNKTMMIMMMMMMMMVVVVVVSMRMRTVMFWRVRFGCKFSFASGFACFSVSSDGFSRYCRKCAISFADEKFEAMVIFTARFAARRCRMYRNGLHSLNIALGVIVATVGQHCRLNAGWFQFCFESL